MTTRVYRCDYVICQRRGFEVRNPSEAPLIYTRPPLYFGQPQSPPCPQCHNPLTFVREELATRTETVAVGAISGAAIGFLIGGFAGAAIGAIVGSGLGGANYEEEKRKKLFGGVL